MKNLSKLFVAFALIFMWVNQAAAQKPLKEEIDRKIAEVKDLVNGGRYTFTATKVILPKGGSNLLSTGYNLDISKDTLIANLPYAGKAQPTPISSGKGDIQFTSTHFNYQMVPGNNGHWEVDIEPTDKSSGDMMDIRKLKLDISSQGYTTLKVTSTNHGSTSYYGYIKAHSAEFPPVSARQ